MIFVSIVIQVFGCCFTHLPEMLGRPSAVAPHEGLKGGVIQPMPLQARQEMLEDIGIAIAAISRQHHLQENVVGKQDAIE